MTRLSTLTALATLLCVSLTASALDPAQTPPAAGAVKPKRPIGAVTQTPRPPIVLTPSSQAPAPAPAAPSAAGQVSILADGTIEERLPDGRIKRSKPGVCGSTIVFPNGKSQSFQCSTNVAKLDLPVPTADAARWLDQHAEELLTIARGLLGGNASTVANHLAANENAAMTVYDRIVVRTALVSVLTQAVTGQ